MQKCKYLDDLGILINEYGINFTDLDDPRVEIWVKQREEYGFDDRETWCLDRIFVEWIYTRFMMYKEKAGKIINLKFYKINDIRYGEMTQEEAMDKVIELTKEILQEDEFGVVFHKNIRVVFDLCKELFSKGCMWW